MMRLLLLIVIVYGALCGACEEKKSKTVEKPVAQAGRLSIAAAATLKPALPSVLEAFSKAHPSVTCEAIYGSSGTFVAQIASGAPIDLLLAADDSFPAKLDASGHATTGSLRVFAGNAVTLVIRRELAPPAGTDAAEALRSLTRDTIKHIALAKPELAPTGRAGREALTALKLWEKVEPKIVQGDNAEKAAAFLSSGAADAAILPTSLAQQEAIAKETVAFAIPAAMHAPMPMAMVIVARSKNEAAAKLLADFMLTDEAQRLLASKGITPLKSASGATAPK